MSLYRTTYVGLICFMLSMIVPSFAVDFSQIERNDYQFFSKEIQGKLMDLSSEYRQAVWPSSEEMVKYGVSSTDIPTDVLTDTVRWIKIMVKSEWIPNNLADRFVGWKKYHPQFNYRLDYLGARYVADGYEIQIVEVGAVCLLVNPIGVIETGQPIESYFKDTIKKFLNFPEDKIDKIEFKLSSVQLANGEILYYGIMDCEYNDSDSAHRNWWNHSSVWSDGKQVFFSLVKMDGTTSKKLQAKPGVIRFKTEIPPIEKSQESVPSPPERKR